MIKSIIPDFETINNLIYVILGRKKLSAEQIQKLKQIVEDLE